MPRSAQSKVQEALDELDMDMDAFLLSNTGKTLTEMAAILELPAQVFIQVHRDWVRDNAPPLLED